LRRLSRKKALAGIAAIVLLVVVGGGATWLARRNGSPSSVGAPVAETTSQDVKVTTGTMKQTISASGTLEPADDSDLTFGVSGTVTAVDVTVGEKVTRGQTLATLDSSALADQVAAAKATLSSDEDQLTTDKDDDAATSTIDSDESQITSAETQLTTAEADLSDATLVATFSGTVASVDLAAGDTVSGGAGGGSSASASTGGSSAGASTTGSLGAASTADSAGDSGASSSSGSSDGITVISTRSYTIGATVDDTEVGEVKAGDGATITPSGSAATLSGTVASVSLIASSSGSDVAAFPVVIDVTGNPTGIYPGATATASIVIKQLDNVVEIPTAAISYSGGLATVTEVSGGSRKTVDVTTGISLNGNTQIKSGLRAGDTIVEEITKFKTSGGSTRSLFGGGGESRTGGGGFPGRGGSFTGGGAPGGGGSPGGGGPPGGGNGS
jgi:multidrug efflux pump subunit AcrA (membrane-fusion protein)